MEISARAGAMALAIVATAVAAAPAPTLGGASIPRLQSHSVDEGPGARAAFVRAPYRWRKGRITYYNAARSSRWAIRKAVRAWNRSGAGVRFVAVPRRRAKVVIRYHHARRCLGVGYAVVEYERRVAREGKVAISRPDASDPACARWALALVTAHELGHVLGLQHEDRRCATMNSTVVGFGPGRCRPTEEWEWRCRLLERDDVRGAVRLYGGRVRRRPRPTCDIFAPPQSPPGISVGVSPVAGGVDAAFEHPVDPPAPRYLPADREGYAFAARLGRCPELLEAPVTPWAVPAGATQRELFLPDEPGRYCFSVWSIDAAGRVSDPASRLADVRFGPAGELLVTQIE